VMKAAAEATLEIASDPKRLGAKIGITSVLHTWGSAMTHHPHVHMIVPGGGLSDDGRRWVGSRANFLVHVHVLAAKFRGKFLFLLGQAHADGKLKFFKTHAGLADPKTFKRFLGPLRHIDWIVYCKPPFAGPEQVLRYLSRYTHRVAISNRRLVADGDGGIAFRYKDYRIDGPGRWKTMTLAPAEFIRRFLIHVLPKGFHRIRHYGLFANGNRRDTNRRHSRRGAGSIRHDGLREECRAALILVASRGRRLTSSRPNPFRDDRLRRVQDDPKSPTPSRERST